MADRADWRPAVRVDRGGRLAKAERVAAGGVRLPGSVIARAGIYVYQRADGSVTRELLPPEEAQSADSLRSLRDAPVTVDHPPKMVSPETYRKDSVGHISGEPTSDGKYVYADVVIHDADAITRIDAGELIETSPGYRLMIDPTPGVWNGEAYDAVQRSRVYNHLAIGRRGWARAGAEACLRIDGVSDVAVEMHVDGTSRGEKMATERIDGVDYEVGSQSWQQARHRFDEKQTEHIAALEKRAKTAEERADAATIEANVAKKERDTARKELADATSQERIDELVDARAELVSFAQKVLGEDADFSGKSNREIMEMVLAQIDPEGEEEEATEEDEAAADSALRIRFETAKRLFRSSTSPLGKARKDALSIKSMPASAFDDFEPPMRLSDRWKKRSA